MKTAFVFPGQGSQFVGMGKDLAEKYLDQASEVLGFDLKKLCLPNNCWVEGPEEELKKTEIQQPAIFAVSVAAFNKLVAASGNPTTVGKPEAVAGHSLGEYSALCAAGAISFEDGIKIVHLRGKFMQEAVPFGEGAMAAVLGAENKLIEEICQQTGEVWPANYNSPDQVVISGKKKSVEAASEKLKQAGAKRILPLPVSAPFHCPLMQPAAEKMKEELNKIEIKDAQIPVVSNVTANYVTEGLKIKERLIKQITHPVLWEDSVRKMLGDGITSFVEVGPGKVLSGLIKKIDKNAEVKSYQEALTQDCS